MPQMQGARQDSKRRRVGAHALRYFIEIFFVSMVTSAQPLRIPVANPRKNLYPATDYFWAAHAPWGTTNAQGAGRILSYRWAGS